MVTLYSPIDLSNGSQYHPCSDDKLSFEIVPHEHKEDEAFFPDVKTKWLDTSKVDYLFGEHSLPLSFLSITTKEDGEAWYREHTKVPDDMIRYLARYHWGDLHPKYKTFDQPKQPKKKKNEPIFSKNEGKFIVEFD